MRVSRVDISKFRGVDETSVPSCGDLNVLIGKNNSGKSTILDAIDGFFAVVSSGFLVALGENVLGRETDFHRGEDSRQPITVSIDLDLDEAELADIVSEVVAEAPQMKHALDDVTPTDRLRVEVRATETPRQFAYVSKIMLGREADLDSGNQRARLLLAVNSTSAMEILRRRETVSRAERQAFDIIDLGQRLDADDFQFLRRDQTERGAGPAARLSRRFMSANPEVAYEIESLIRHAESYADFRRQLEALANTAQSSALRAEKDPLAAPISTFSGDASSVPQYAMSILRRVGSITLLHLRDRRDPVGKEEAQRLLALKTRRKGPEVLRNIQDTVQSLLGVSIDAFESERVPGREAHAEMDVDEILVEMNGAGIREALRLILDNELGAPQLLLVEEPEVHLHPALELSMLRYLKSASSRTQIFVTTHSTNFLDTSEMRNVYLTRRDPWVRVSLLDYEHAEAAIPDELGLRLSSLFMYDRLVFVEGASDEAVLRELASTVGVNFGQSNVGFVIMGSARNFTHYASQSTIDLLSKRRVKMFFILDRDEASDEEVSALTSRLSDIAQTHVLQRREIENYLAVPRALTEFICEKRRLSGADAADVTVEAVAAQLDRSADNLRSLAIEKRVSRTLCSPVFFDRNSVLDQSQTTDFVTRLASEIERQASIIGERVEQISKLMEEEQERVGKTWDSKKMDIVPGHELVDAVCQAFGVRFKKRRDGARLASFLQEDEVPSELMRLLKSLVD